jgi:hypothetical protein
MASKREIVRIVAGLLEFLRQVKMKIGPCNWKLLRAALTADC